MMTIKNERRSPSFIASATLKGPSVVRAERQSQCIGNWLSRNTIDESYRRRTEQPIEVEPNLADHGNFPSFAHRGSLVSANPRLACGNLSSLCLIPINYKLMRKL